MNRYWLQGSFECKGSSPRYGLTQAGQSIGYFRHYSVSGIFASWSSKLDLERYPATKNLMKCTYHAGSITRKVAGQTTTYLATRPID